MHRKRYEFFFDAVLESIDDTELEGPFYFHLHDSYKPSKIKVSATKYGGKQAILEEINSNGTFTVGIQFKDGGGTWRSLEY